MDISEDEADAETNVFLPPQGDVSAYDLWKIHLEKRTFRQEYLDQWNETVGATGTGRPMDAIIAPVSANASAPHGFNRSVVHIAICPLLNASRSLFRSAAYTAIWNALDYPACTFPVTKADPKVDVKKPAHQFLGDSDKAHYDFCKSSSYLSEIVWCLYT